MRTRMQIVLVALLALIPLACSGTDDIIAQQAGLSIDGDNAAEIGGAVLGSAEFVGELADMLLGFSDLIGEGGTGTYLCPGGGSVEVQANDVEPLGVMSPGDSATLTFDGCAVSFGDETINLNGSVTIVILEPATTAQLAVFVPFSLRSQINFNDTVLVYPDETITLNGQIVVTYGSTDGVVYTTEVEGTLLSAHVQEVAGDSYDNELRSFFFGYSDNESNGRYVLGFAGQLWVSNFGPFGAAFIFASTTALAGTDPNYPDTGIWYVEAFGGRCTYIVQNASTVRMEIDIDGDGNPDVIKDASWFEMLD